MKLAIHQPEHLPWPGFFHKMMHADVYVYLDHVQYRDRNFQNRNRLINRNGKVAWITIPLRQKSRSETIREKRISENACIDKYLSSIELSYKDAKYFDCYFERFSKIVKNSDLSLIQLNLNIIDFFREELEITTKTVMSSELNIKSHKSDLILDICLRMRAKSYIFGSSGIDYLDLDKFKHKGVNMLMQQFTPPKYNATVFSPGLSTLDLLFNEGKRSRDIIKNAGSIVEQ